MREPFNYLTGTFARRLELIRILPLAQAPDHNIESSMIERLCGERVSLNIMRIESRKVSHNQNNPRQPCYQVRMPFSLSGVHFRLLAPLALWNI